MGSSSDLKAFANHQTTQQPVTLKALLGDQVFWG
ncbi:hypothetical protein BpOF4 [Alkalihalophilus pseudofirmus OF4]|uniref:Uncharacterized protein n=1 Tax=Alkalihalophilus pseudofirmus (strain ATCC BAA-2126 / JCM 17055 / OF4) TaxID=398511 RepID=D3G0A2_ALKPO|nr:hypothetical protein BpOF4 [Alkalihalophilus pseudofirmus OF4]